MIVALLLVFSVFGEVPTSLSYQGKLVDGGVPVTASRAIGYMLFVDTGGDGFDVGDPMAWSQSPSDYGVNHGIFSSELDFSSGFAGGGYSSIQDVFNSGYDLYLQVWVGPSGAGFGGCTALSPADKITSHGFAFGVADKAISPDKLADGTADGQVLQWDGTAGEWKLVDGSGLGANSLQDAYDGGNVITTDGTSPVVILAGDSDPEALYVGGSGGGNAIKTGGNIWMETGNLAMDDGHISVVDGFDGGSIIYAKQTGTNRAATSLSTTARSFLTATRASTGTSSFATPLTAQFSMLMTPPAGPRSRASSPFVNQARTFSTLTTQPGRFGQPAKFSRRAPFVSASRAPMSRTSTAQPARYGLLAMFWPRATSFLTTAETTAR